ncbi:RNA polymerase sigma factor [Phyllobacterium sp. 21LDTY02-6]|uniref:RNA polymerase sigma factor n=1 Tax=Phyllobacterium sp. 21LDTY02-6 TaxID=2944903 RepID=UPI00208EDBAB|nr:RNA polymerase sigma factor [Phyllobacterium sp. 21LDTY02-6]MCO4316943.1 RNA polymerase sigma factor [Phyllobacterium sp. 21LDTY02-6]
MNSRVGDIERLYNDEHLRLERQIRHKVGCAATARDLVQDIFLRIWGRAIECTGNQSAFLNRCARNAAIDHLRAEKARARFLEGILPEQYAGVQSTPLDEMVVRDSIRTIDQTLAALPTRTRHIFLLNRIHGRSFVDIAGAFDISERAVAKHMSRAVSACEMALADNMV